MNWTRRQELHLREVALQATAYSCSATAWYWGDRLDLHQLRRGHGPRAIYFAFCHVIGTAGATRTHKFLLLRELPEAKFGYSGVEIGEPYGCRSHHDGLKGRLLRRLLTVRVW